MSSATTAVTLRFASTVATAVANDSVVLTVTAGEEENVMEAVAGAIAEARSGMTVIASDVSGKTSYIHPGITAVSSISVDSGAGTFKNIVDAAFSSNDIAVTNAQSGSVILVPTTGDNSTITLPSSPIDGANYKFVAEASSGAHTITIAGAFYGVTLQAGDTVEHALGSTSAVIAASDFKIGDFFEIVYEGDAYHITGMFDTAASLAVS
tara:strand:+ start:206 stop:832 length:627 start_codon:yes stop_codon:yes gene_type:complete